MTLHQLFAHDCPECQDAVIDRVMALAGGPAVHATSNFGIYESKFRFAYVVAPEVLEALVAAAEAKEETP